MSDKKEKNNAKNKLIALILSIILALGVMPISVFAGVTEDSQEADQNITITVKTTAKANDSFTEDAIYNQIDNQYARITYKLYREGVDMGSSYNRVASTSNNWECAWENLPKYDNRGMEYIYSVKRYLPDNVIAPLVAGSANKLPGENNYFSDSWTIPEQCTVTAQLKWDDNENIYGTRPENVGKVLLSYGDSEDLREAALTKNADGTYNAVWENVPTSFNGSLIKKYSFTVPEIDVNYKNYKMTQTGSYQKYVITESFDAESFSAVYITQPIITDEIAANLKDYPKTITATLYKGNEVAPIPDAVVTFQMGGTDGKTKQQTHKWLLPKYTQDGTPIELPDGKYKVVWDTVESKHLQTRITEVTDRSVFILTFPYASIYHYHYLPCKWDDNNNFNNIRPKELSVTLLANGQPVDGLKSASLLSTQDYFNPQGWTYLPRYDEEGNLIHYTLDINGLPKYYEYTLEESPKFDETNGYGSNDVQYLMLTSNLSLKTQKVSAKVVWQTDESDIEKKNRPNSVDLTLEYTTDGTNWQTYWGKSSYAVSADDDGWNIEWDLPEVDAEGNPVTFRVKEKNLGVYSTTYDSVVTEDEETGKKTTNLTVTNTYQDAWTYNIDLSWDTSDINLRHHQDDITLNSDTKTLKYQLTISANDSYEAGKLEVRLPYALWLDRNGDAVVPASHQISVPMYPGKNPNYAFSYEIDKHGSDNPMDYEIVFTNRDPISTGFKQTLTVGYTVLPRETIDCSNVTLKATGTGTSTNQTDAESKTSNSIDYQIDTGAKLTGFYKTNYSGDPSLKGLMYVWDTTFGTKPSDFDTTKYNYVGYRLTPRVERNQPYWLEFEDLPDSEGKIVSVMYYAYNHADGYNVGITYDKTTGRWKSQVFTALDSNDYSEPCYYVAVAYPRKEQDGDEKIQYRNDARIYCYAADGHPDDKTEKDYNDVSDMKSGCTVTWEDYKFNYTGELSSDSKSMSSFPSAGVTILQNGKDIDTNFSFYKTVNGYNLENGYSFTMDDDAVYAYATIDGKDTKYVRLTDEDYSFISSTPMGVGVSIKCSDIDRKTGVTIDPEEFPETPFEFWAKTDKGEWSKIYDITINSKSSLNYVPADLINGKNYTAFRVTSPEGLSGRYSVGVYGRINLKSTSPLFKSWSESGELTKIRVDNFAVFRTYAADEQGIYSWIDGKETPNLQLARLVGLTREDIAREGLYPIRSSYGAAVSAAVFDSYIGKYADKAAENDTEHSKADVTFTIYESESVNSTQLPEEVYKNLSQNSGVFYDLLPLGYSLNPDKPITVWGNYNSNSFGYKVENAVLNSYKVINNYRGTGRQMVIFNVSTLLEDGQNWKPNYQVYTGFRIEYSASISWEDYALFPSGYNIVAFQRGDNHQIEGRYSFSEQGYPGTSQDKEKFIDDADGNPVLSDLDNDGELDEKNTMYAYAFVNPEVYTTVQSGISKAVKGNSSFYTQDDITDPDGEYSYKVQMTTSDGGTTSDVILIDILENASNIDGGVNEKGWKGTFTGLNCSIPEKQGIDVKVYYSAVPNLSYNDEEKMKLDATADGVNIWSTTPPDDLSKVTAVAFDLRTGVDGNPFEFVNEQSTYVEIFMKAPSELQGDAIYAYNRPSYWSKFQVSGGNVPQTVLNNGNRTTIKIRDLQAFSFKKLVDNTDAENGKSPLGGTLFKLYAHKDEVTEDHQHTGKPGDSSSCWETAPIRTITSQADGTVVFDRLDSGTYAIAEAKANTGVMLMNNCYWVINVDATEGTVSSPETFKTSDQAAAIDFQSDDDGNYFLVNERQKKDLTIYKGWTDDSITKVIRPETVWFDLYRDGVLYKSAEYDTSKYNITLFKGLYINDLYGKAYNYTVRERTVPGYTPNSEQYNVYMNSSSPYISVQNQRLGILEIKKLVSENGEKDLYFTFNVALTDESGNSISEVDKDGNTVKYTVRRYTTADSTTYTEETVELAKGGIAKLTAKHGERLLLIGLPLGTKYTVTETGGSGYDSEVTSGTSTGTTSAYATNSVTFTNTRITTTIAGSKTWTDGNDQDGIRPDQITVRLLADGTEVKIAVVKPDANGKWSWSFADLPKYKAGQEIKYTITEDAVEGYETQVSGYNVTNKHVPYGVKDFAQEVPPQTSDTCNINFWLFFAILSGGLVVTLCSERKIRRRLIK